ncbi:MULTISPECIES: hypothetical protein [unclassified Microcoleus]|uniref:hypothetical protein n=1 Tax=unclassified Microcoleus TaxID=2642155 RepID=UPI002FD77666
MKTPIRDRPNIRDSNPRDRARADSKPEPSQGYGLPFLGITKSDELGALGGVGIRGDVSIYVPVEVPVQVIFNPVTESVKVAAGFDIGIAKIKLGVTAQNTDQGGAIQNSSFGVGFLGFGVSAEGTGTESSKLGVSAFGFDVSIANDKDGRISIRIGFGGIPGFEVGVTFTPDGGEIEITPTPTPAEPTTGDFPVPSHLVGCDVYRKLVAQVQNQMRRSIPDAGIPLSGYGRIEKTAFFRNINLPYSEYKTYDTSEGIGRLSFYEATNYKRFFYRGDVFNFLDADKSKVYGKTVNLGREATKAEIDAALAAAPSVLYEEYIVEFDYYCDPNQQPFSPPSTPSPLPNYPQNYKPMNCCDKVDEIYKYLGIGKFKSKKFKLSNAFLVPGGKGNIEIEDYYELTEALFRMLANGLIINPEASPNGTPWKVANASAWAAQMYEMAAESMSDGNSSQKVEIALMMQLAQIMKVLAETVRKVEFLADATGYTPVVNTEEVPICFTIYEGHKGFGKKDKQVIDVSQAKTDEQVENTILKMLNPSKIPITKWEFDPNSISIKKTLDAM